MRRTNNVKKEGKNDEKTNISNDRKRVRKFKK